MTGTDLYEPAIDLSGLQTLLTVLSRVPDALRVLGEMAERVGEALHQGSSLPLLPLPGLAADLQGVEELETAPLPGSEDGDLAKQCRSWLARSRRWLGLAPVVAEMGRRLGGQGALKPRVLAEAARLLDQHGADLACRAVIRTSRAHWHPGGVELPELDCTFSSRTLAGFYGTPLQAREEDEFDRVEEQPGPDRWPSRVALFAGTIGPGLEERARGLFGAGSPFAGVVMDALASALVERMAAGLLELLAREELLPEPPAGGLFRRYHLGYGDWSLVDQEQLFRALTPERIGISLTSSFLMLPEKSLAGLAAAKVPAKRIKG